MNDGQTSARSTCVASLRDLENSKMLWGYVYMNLSKGDEVCKLPVEISLKYAGMVFVEHICRVLEYKYKKAPPLI